MEYQKNQLRHLYKILTIIMLVSLISACTLRPGPAGQPTKVEYHKGIEGITVEFLENIPPKEVPKSSDFLIGLRVHNKGAYSVFDGSLKILQPDPRYTKMDEKETNFALEGKSPAYPEGELDIFNFKAQNIAITQGASKQLVTLTAVIYYDYETLATANVCIDPDIYGFSKDIKKACETKEVTLAGGQGAPIAITKVIPTPILSSDATLTMNFKVSVANKGKGFPLKNLVEIKEAFLGQQKVECTPKIITIKKGKEATFNCEHTLEKPRGAYTTPLRVRLAYVYSQESTKKINIVDPSVG